MGAPLGIVFTIKILDHVYFVHPPNDISVDSRPTYRSTYRPSVGRHIGRVSIDISTEMSLDISADISVKHRSICRPRVVVRLSVDMSIDRLLTFRRYFTATCVLVTVDIT